MDLMDKIIAYESGRLNQEETVELFQGLVDTGMIPHLQGHYARMANALIEQGYVTPIGGEP